MVLHAALSGGFQMAMMLRPAAAMAYAGMGDTIGTDRQAVQWGHVMGGLELFMTWTYAASATVAVRQLRYRFGTMFALSLRTMPHGTHRTRRTRRFAMSSTARADRLLIGTLRSDVVTETPSLQGLENFVRLSVITRIGAFLVLLASFLCGNSSALQVGGVLGDVALALLTIHGLNRCDRLQTKPTFANWCCAL